MIAPEMRRHSTETAWPAGDGRRLDIAPPGNPPAAAGGFGTASVGAWIDRAVAERPWMLITAAAVVGVTAGWLLKRR